MNYRTGKILLITSLLLWPAAWSPAWGEEPAFLYTHIHREGSSVTREESRVEEKTSSKTTTHSDVSVNLPSAPAAGGSGLWSTVNKLIIGEMHNEKSNLYHFSCGSCRGNYRLQTPPTP